LPLSYFWELVFSFLVHWLWSLACDKCNCWYHYKCAELTGEEAFLSKKKLLGIAVIVVRKERVKEKERRNRKWGLTI
jgi:hypothetical protein